ncbi:hypothetical protein MRB53_039558 [Persea americana]|nr:hypothetical protein MRB53_039558 [Persea americana]
MVAAIYASRVVISRLCQGITAERSSDRFRHCSCTTRVFLTESRLNFDTEFFQVWYGIAETRSAGVCQLICIHLVLDANDLIPLTRDLHNCTESTPSSDHNP